MLQDCRVADLTRTTEHLAERDRRAHSHRYSIKWTAAFDDLGLASSQRSDIALIAVRYFHKLRFQPRSDVSSAGAMRTNSSLTHADQRGQLVCVDVLWYSALRG